MLYQFHLIDILFLLAVVAGQDTVADVEVGRHRLVVGDALGVVALHNAAYLVRRLYGFLLDDFVVMDDVENDFWGYDGKSGDLIVSKELVADLDDALHTNFLGGVVVTDGYGRLEVEKSEEVGHLIGLGGGYVIDDGALLDGSN